MNNSSPLESLLSPYTMGTWVCWILLLFCAGWFRRWRGIILGELTVATTVFMLHLRWMHEAMTQFDVRGKLTLDAHFFVGVTLSAMVVDVILFPAGLLGLLARAGNRQRPSSAPPPLPRAGE